MIKGGRQVAGGGWTMVCGGSRAEGVGCIHRWGRRVWMVDVERLAEHGIDDRAKS